MALTLNDHVGRQIWEFGPKIESPEELVEINNVRDTFRKHRFEKKHSSDLLMRIQGTYLHHKEIKVAHGIKITAQGLEHAIAGVGLYVVGPNDDLEDIKESTMEDMRLVMNMIDKTGEGSLCSSIYSRIIGSIAGVLKIPSVNIPVSGISICPVHKKDVMKASVMLEKMKEYATILAFDVKVTPEVRELADEYGVKIFIADIIYHLLDQFKVYIDTLKVDCAPFVDMACMLGVIWG